MKILFCEPCRNILNNPFTVKELIEHIDACPVCLEQLYEGVKQDENSLKELKKIFFKYITENFSFSKIFG
jgi:hypothetical protein